jgi:hypothetical protein
MHLKRTKLGVLLAGTLLTGISIGRFCFPQGGIASTTESSPVTHRKTEARSSTGDRSQSVANDAAPARSRNGAKDSPQESASVRLANFTSGHPDIAERCEFTKKLITELCAQGKDDEAYGLIHPNAGHMRQMGLFAFYSNSSLDKNELMAMVRREDFTDMLGAMHGYMRGMEIDQLKAETESSRVADFLRERGSEMPPDLIKGAIAVALQDHLKDAGPEESREIFNVAKDLVANGKMSDYELYVLAGDNKSLTSFEKWDFLKDIDPKDQNEADQNYKTKNREKLIASMMRADGGKTMGALLDGQTPGRVADVNTAVRVWNQLDSEGVADWFQQNQSSLSPTKGALVATTLSTIAAEFMEYDSARRWAGQIRDPAARAEAMKMVEEKVISHQKWLAEKNERRITGGK